MLKIKDIYTAHNGFFTDYNRIIPENYHALFNDINSDYLDFLFFNNYSEKIINPSIIEDILTENDRVSIIHVIDLKYFDTWMKIKSALMAEYEVINPYSITENLSSNSTDIGDIQGSNINKMSTYAFDSTNENEVDKDLTEDTSRTIRNLTIQRERIFSRTGNTGTRTNAELINQELKLRNKRLYDIILNNVSDFLTLSIY